MGCTLVNSTVLVAGRWFGRVHGLIIVPNHLKPPPTGPQEDTTACNYSFNTTRLVSSGPPLQFQNHIELVLRGRRPIDMPIEQFQNHFELVSRGRGPVYPPGIERARGERPVCSFKTTSVQVALKWMGVWSRSGFEMDGCLVSRVGEWRAPNVQFQNHFGSGFEMDGCLVSRGGPEEGPICSFKTTREWF